ncbi:DNA-formamidopyrimidine glycosylase [Marinicrinis sediminis]|uniref:Formamidopyrimidine-DNA glycosylase n=1 Tax=Marinicrinis sediminis TaxID=1652465 RepID=A0ABW5R9P9_9BACL
MPELPEVETVRRTLNQLVTGKKIEHVQVNLARIIQRPADIEQFCMILQGETIHGVERRGKFLRFVMDHYVMVSHLRMEGRYGVYPVNEPVEKHTHVQFTFTDGLQLRYRDVRQFGTMHIFGKGEEFLHAPLHKLGLEPLNDTFTVKAMQQVIGNKSTRLKAFLLNQAYIVGLGNIYVDEALFTARLHPERTIDTLTEAELVRLHEAIVTTLQTAVDQGGSSIKSYVNGQGEMGMFQQQLRVYGRKNQPCHHCGQVIEKSVVAGRGTHVCLNCQPL